MSTKYRAHRSDFKPLCKSYVIVIAGYVGSGKSTVAASLSKILEDAPILTFDHYEKYMEWPQDMNHWLNDGADPNQIRIPKLKEHLLSLLRGRMQDIFALDDDASLAAVSMAYADSRLFCTAVPSTERTKFKGLAVLDFAPVQNVKQNVSPSFDGRLHRGIILAVGDGAVSGA